ncbi:MaoC/PaaZ C-terminal domain-containing protein [Zhongshania aquimaris]|uniref:MaoC-like domain-containing protein n=1 Tax=Zhongshania aquimaris TaxID=2857107 RepID=A0ABS6VNK5_9GAMM|nr:MaoC/PaaZ C-terminal domain-containing protein [Zhongshania aquimaris]MBW2939904.1 hypothetical protein [Zhongshania aquimaris]
MSTTSAPKITFDDIAQLEACISDEFGPRGSSISIDQETIDSFAVLTTDQQWIHVDRERAINGPFGTTVAHGFLILSMLPAIRPVNKFELAGWSSAATYGIRALRFLQPVASGNHIYARSRLLGVEAHRRGTLLTSEIMIQSIENTNPSLLFELQLLYMP